MTERQTPGAGERLPLSDLSQSLQLGVFQLSAMLAETHGESGALFRNLPADIQDRFMLGVQAKTDGLLRMAEALSSALVGINGEVQHG